MWMTKDNTVIPMPKRKKPKAKPKQLYLDKIIAQEEKNKSPTSIPKDFYKIGGTD